MMEIQPRIALITGANKGIGLETARQLAQAGLTVLLAARDSRKAEQAVAQLAQEGLQVHPITLDVTDPAQIAAAATAIKSEYGRLDVLINNAAIIVEEGGFSINTTTTLTMAELRQTFDTNFFGAVELTRALLPLLQRAAAARIVNLTSILGSLELHATPGSPIYDSKAFAYDSSKTAINAFTVHLAHALKDTPIKVNSAHPGWVKTEMGGDHAPMEIVDGARTSVWLATLPAEGPTGGVFHDRERLPW